MTLNKSQEKTALLAGFLQIGIGLGCHAFSQRYEPSIPIHCLAQVGNILFISSLISFISSFHAYLSRLYQEEKQERERLGDGENVPLFEDEFEEAGRYARAFHQFENIIIPVLLAFISCVEVALTSWVIWMESTHVHDVIPEDRSVMLPMASIIAFSATLLFILSKYCTGLVYGNKKYYLRSISSYTLYSSSACTLVVIVSMLFYWGYPTGLSITTWILCALSLFISIERVGTWIIDLYRPQSKHAHDLTVYESRFLGLFSQPQGMLKSLSDLIDYQFGITVSEGLIYRCLTRVLLPFVLLQLVTLALLSCVIYIETHEKGILEQWRSESLEVLGPGLHFRLPWPICRVYRVATERIQQLTISSDTEEADKQKKGMKPTLLWTDENLSENLFLAASVKGARYKNKSKATASIPVNLASVKINIHYQVEDCIAYHISCSAPEELLRHLGRQELLRYMIGHDFPSLLKSGIEGMRKDLASQIQRAVASHGLGIRIVNLNVENLQPPSKVALSYRDIIETQEKRTEMGIKAEQYAVQIGAEAEQEANRFVREAESDTALITRLAEVEKSNYLRQYQIYKKYPQLYKTRSTMDVLEEWLQDVRKVVVTTGDAREVINLELKRMQPDLLSAPLE